MWKRSRPVLLVLIQFAAMLAIALTGPIIPRQPLLLLVVALGIALGFWAIVAMRPWNFNVTPSVKIDGIMVTRGPYAFIRHPMYAALLTIMGALVVNHLTPLRVLLLTVFVADIVFKLQLEERLLSAHYPAYASYMQHTRRLIPFFY